MNEKFQRLEPEKRTRILKAAFSEFAEKGYEHASTNTIAKEAGIGKGTVFYYFGSKEKLFTILIDQAIEIMDELYFEQVNFEERDIFRRLFQFSQVKQRNYPLSKPSFDFLGHVFLNRDKYEQIYKNLKEKHTEVEKGITDLITKNIDFTKFREGIAAEKALKLIYWSIEGYREELMGKLKELDFTSLEKEDLQPYFEEFYEYIHILQKAYYKPEYVDKDIQSQMEL